MESSPKITGVYTEFSESTTPRCKIYSVHNVVLGCGWIGTVEEPIIICKQINKAVPNADDKSGNCEGTYNDHIKKKNI